MISYSRDPQPTIPLTSVKIIGLGGAGANILRRIALDGLEGTELLALNTDTRTLDSSLAQDKIQLGANLTKGLGTGGDPELGHQAALEAEDAIRAAMRGCRIVFLCTGLGGGTSSGAAPLVTRIAREEGAFVVIFATMPFAFEGKRRREQAETALNQLAVLSNALVTFDNNRMGELVLAQQGIHEAFVAADHMIGESIKAVIRLVARPGLIHIGLDDLMTALRTNRSRCLFGSGIASGPDRAADALRNALASPLLDQGALLKDAQSVLVHLAGGEDLSLFEIEQLMQELHKSIPASAHLLFGAAVDPAMGDSLSVTVISSMPDDTLACGPKIQATSETPTVAESELAAAPAETKQPAVPSHATAAVLSLFAAAAAEPEPAAPVEDDAEPAEAERDEEPAPAVVIAEFIAVATAPTEKLPLLQPEEIAVAVMATESAEPVESANGSAIPANCPPEVARWAPVQEPKPVAAALDNEASEAEPPKLKLGVKPTTPQSELSLDSAPRGRFDGENPNVFEGEDLDLPPFLRKKK